MRKNTKVIAEFFESTAIENALKFGIRNLLIFGDETYCKKYENVTLYVSEKYDDFLSVFKEKGLNLSLSEPLLCSFLHCDFSEEKVYSVLEQLKKFPEGTTVIFTHCNDMYDTEKKLSDCSFRTVEHFSLDKVAHALVKKEEKSGENNCYCFCIRK